MEAFVFGGGVPPAVTHIFRHLLYHVISNGLLRIIIVLDNFQLKKTSVPPKMIASQVLQFELSG